jgi:predicted nucleic acid-binding protein
VNVVDSSGWLEYFGNGPNAAFFEEPLLQVDELIVPAISIFEVFKRVLQQRDETSALQAAALMQQGRTVALDPPLAMAAAKMSCDLKLPMADSIILATAR